MSGERRTAGRAAGMSARALLIAACALSGLALVAACAAPPRIRLIMPPPPVSTEAAPAAADPQTPQPTPFVAPTPPRVGDVTIVAVGDLMLARRITTLMEQHGPAYPFEHVRPLLEGADVVVGNMEGTFTERGTALTKQYTFRTPPALASGLATAGFDAVSLANNHATDFGAVSLEDTRAALRTAGVQAFGVGDDRAAAIAPLVLHAANGASVALLGVDDIPEVTWATDAQAGVARADPEALGRAVTAACSQADYVVVFAHWGAEYSHIPTARQRALARAAIEAGASLVLGAHPHVLQPTERIGDGLVAYSLGNFVFDLDADDLSTLGAGPFESAVVRVTLSRSAAPRLEVVPARIDPTENRPRRATPAEAAPILEQLRELAAPPPAVR